jgi:hypothetical protein
VDSKFQHIQSCAGIAISKDSYLLQRLLIYGDTSLTQSALFIGQGTLKESDDLLFREAFQRENTRAGQERTIYLEAGILSGCPNEGYNSSLDVWQNGILLRLIKAVNLIDE